MGSWSRIEPNFIQLRFAHAWEDHPRDIALKICTELQQKTPNKLSNKHQLELNIMRI